MASDWADSTIERIAAPQKNALVGGPFGSDLVSKDYVPRGVPVIRGQNMGIGRWVAGSFVYVSEEKGMRLNANKARPGDIVFTQRGTLGQIALVPKSPFEEYVVSQSQMKLTVDARIADPVFVYYALQTPWQQEYIRNNAIQTGVPHTNLSILRKTPICLPPLNEQKKIAEILGAIDGKTEHCAVMNASLEAIAHAIFKSWFMDFDPVRAKTEGREPEGMDATTAALFPNTFEDSELGPIPQGWSARPITDVLSLNPARSLKKKATSKYLDMASVPTFGPRATSWIERDFVSGSKFINGDTLLARITPCLENGKTAYVDFLEHDEVGWGSTEFIVIATKQSVPSQFGYLLARDPEFRQHAIQSMSGTSGRQRVQVDQLAMFRIAVANASIYRAFGTLVEPLFRSIKCGSEEQVTLADLRDTLLPRLILGKLRVPEAERLVEAVL